MQRIKKLERREDNIFEPILEKLSTIASGATTIGSTGHAPDHENYWVLSEESLTY
jgi:hypothetical protein